MQDLLKQKFALRMTEMSLENVIQVAEAYVYMDKGCVFEPELLVEIKYIVQGLLHKARWINGQSRYDALAYRQDMLNDGYKLVARNGKLQYEATINRARRGQ